MDIREGVRTGKIMCCVQGDMQGDCNRLVYAHVGETLLVKGRGHHLHASLSLSSAPPSLGWVSTMDPKSASNEEVYNGGKLIEAAAASPFD